MTSLLTTLRAGRLGCGAATDDKAGGRSALGRRISLVRRWTVPATILLLAVGTVAARRRGYGIGGHTIVRCRDGHLFTTIWIPGASVKAVRLGPRRFQHCPVGHHWTLVRPVRADDLTEDERAEAERNRDVRIP